jgi:glycosyltransferase involved in cell wall biosynthesis
MTSPATVLVDLRASQINGDRGISAYSQSLTLELARLYPRHRWLLLQNPSRPLPARASELGEHATWCTVADLEGPRLPPIDVLFTACFFFVPHTGRVADAMVPPVVRRQQPKRMGIVYDLIPLLFQDRYLTNENTRRSYFESLLVLRESDHLFAISHATRRDTIHHAAIDPKRVHCIYGDIDHTKHELMARPATDSAAVPAQHGLGRRYCAYVGGDDWRKNLDTAVQAFAVFWRAHSTHQLAIVCRLPNERIADLQRLAAAEGLPAGAVVCTGFVSDEELVGLVRHADMVVFPSLYEGLGLPVLEAYGCGTPVVGSNTSSVAELVLPELSCDPRSPASIAATMDRLVTHESLREASLALGRRLAEEELGWPRAAERVMEHIESRPRVTRQPALATRDARFTHPLPRVAVVTGLTAQPKRATATAMNRLQDADWQTTFYGVARTARLATPSRLARSSRVLPVEVLPAALLRGRHDAVIFVVGSSPHDATVLDAVIRSRGTLGERILWLYDDGLDEAFQSWTQENHQGSPPADPTAAALRLLVERGELDRLAVDSDACRDRVCTALGSLARSMPILVASKPEQLGVLARVTAPDTTAACSHGAA